MKVTHRTYCSQCIISLFAWSYYDRSSGFIPEIRHHESYAALLDAVKEGCVFCTDLFQTHLENQRNEPDPVLFDKIMSGKYKVWFSFVTRGEVVVWKRYTSPIAFKELVDVDEERREVELELDIELAPPHVEGVDGGEDSMRLVEFVEFGTGSPVKGRGGQGRQPDGVSRAQNQRYMIRDKQKESTKQRRRDRGL
jgi:hypothetical protein